MEWALTLNKHRLYDVWSNGVSDLKFSGGSFALGMTVIEQSLSATLMRNPAVVVGGVLAGSCICVLDFAVICQIANAALALTLWTAVKTCELAFSLLFAEQNEIDILPNVLAFEIADTLTVDHRIAFLNHYTCDTIAAYLSDTNSKRLNTILQEYHGKIEQLPPKWEDAIYSVALSVKELSFEGVPDLNESLGKLVDTFPYLERFTAKECKLDFSAILRLEKLQRLTSLRINELVLQQEGTRELYASLACHPHLQILELSLPNIPLGDLAPLVERTQRLKKLRIENATARITEEHLTALLKLPVLEALSLSGTFTWASVQALKRIGELKSLTHLSLQSTTPTGNLTGQDMPAFSEMPLLEEVELHHLPVNNEHLLQLTKSAINLQTLRLAHCDQVTEQGISHLHKSTNTLKALALIECAGIQDAACGNIARLTTLESLEIAARISDHSIDALSPLQALTSLQLIGTGIAEGGMQTIGAYFPHLRSLVLDRSEQLLNSFVASVRHPTLELFSINNCPKIDDYVAHFVSQILSLKSFSASHTQLTSNSWHYWSEHPCIETLTLRKCPVANEHIPHLPSRLRALHAGKLAEHVDTKALAAQCPQLTELSLGSRNMTKELLHELQALEFLKRFETHRPPMHNLGIFQEIGTKRSIQRIVLTARFHLHHLIGGVVLPPAVAFERDHG